MDEATFQKALKGVSAIPEELKKRLLALSPRMEPHVRQEIIDDLTQADRNETALVEEGVAALQAIVKKVSSAERAEREGKQREEENKSLPDFHS